MDATLNTIVRQFGLSRGVLQEHPKNVAWVEAATSPGARRSRGNLYVLVEVLGGLPDPSYTLGCLTEIIRDEYYRATGSVTGAIGAALRAANDWLFEENLNSPREQRGVAGASCVALRDAELYLGQLGPSLAYLWQADGLRRFPEDSPWLRQAIPTDAERAASPPLGVRRVVEPQFYHATLSAGDAFLLASPALARYALGRAVADALAQGPDAARQHLLALAQDRDLNALVVGVEAGAPVSASSEHDELALPDEEVEPEPLPIRPASPLRVDRPVTWGASDTGQAVRASLARIGCGLATLARHLLPTRRPSAGGRRPAVPATTQGRPPAQTLALLAVLIPVVTLAIVLITRFQYERSRRAQVVDLLRRAAEARASVVDTGQREIQRQALRQAIQLIDQALELAPEEATAVAVRREVVQELDNASAVQRLYTLWELADLGAETAGSLEMVRIVVRGPDIFVLDRATDAAYHRVLNPAGDALEAPAADALLVRQGATHGAIAVGELVDVVWMPVGGERTQPNLMILERNGSLLEWEPLRGITVLPVADSAGWRKPQAAGAFGGNFYLLDPQQNRIMKYLPTAAGYTSPPTDYLGQGTQVDLSGAVDMAIDGHIYVLLADGSILKFLSGGQQNFRLVDLDEPLRNPVALFVTGEDDARGYLYVVDAGLARVVQFTKQGEFIRQFKAVEGQPQLDQLRGLFVDEVKQRMFLASGSRLYMAPLQQSPQPAPTAVPASGQ